MFLEFMYPFLLSRYPFRIMLLASLLALIWGIRAGSRNKQLRFIPWYAGTSFLQNSLPFALHYCLGDKLGSWFFLVPASINLFLAAEYFLFSRFLLQVIQSAGMKKLIRSMMLAFLLILLYTWISSPSTFLGNLYSPLFILESVFLLIPGIRYYQELFRDNEVQDLFGEPAFWVVTGILFLTVISIPIFLWTGNYVTRTDHLPIVYVYALNYLTYAILFLLLFCASWCNLRRETRLA